LLGQLDTAISDSINSTITKYQPGNQIKRSEMGGACGKGGGKQKYTYIFGEEIKRKEIACKSWGRWKRIIKIYLKGNKLEWVKMD
jgi:hypothetical protein